MKYLSVAQTAKNWGVSERSVRKYCSSGRVEGAFLNGKTWNVPQDAQKPARINQAPLKPTILLDILKEEKNSRLKGGIYHKLQIELTYNSNHIEGSRLSHDQTRYIYETNTIGEENEVLYVDDIVETANHFRCIDMVIDNAGKKLTETFIKRLHLTLKSGTSDSRKDWFMVGDYKLRPNEVGGTKTTSPKNVEAQIKQLLELYGEKENLSFEEILDFHYEFEKIHPFQDGNGRIGRLILLSQCLSNNIVPFIIDESLKMYYYRGLKEYKNEKGYLTDTCLTGQDRFKKILDYFEIEY